MTDAYDKTDRPDLVLEAAGHAAREAEITRQTRNGAFWFAGTFVVSALLVVRNGMPASFAALGGDKLTFVGACMMVFCASVGPLVLLNIRKTLREAPTDQIAAAGVGRRVAGALREDGTMLQFHETARLPVDEATLIARGVLPTGGALTYRNGLIGVFQWVPGALLEYRHSHPGQPDRFGSLLWLKPSPTPPQGVRVSPIRGGAAQGTSRFRLETEAPEQPAQARPLLEAVEAYGGTQDARAARICALTLGDGLVIALARDAPLYPAGSAFDADRLAAVLRSEVDCACDAAGALCPQD